MDKKEELIKKIVGLPKGSIILISGFGGSGKSTLAKYIQTHTCSYVVSGDEFYLDPHSEYEWLGYNYKRLVNEVMIPFTDNPMSTLTYRSVSWNNKEDIHFMTIPKVDYLVVEGVGLLREETLKYSTLSIWIDCPLDKAIAQGKYRDHHVYGVNHDDLWDTIWRNNEVTYEQKHQPRKQAEVLYVEMF